jgi:hypothetical protein
LANGRVQTPDLNLYKPITPTPLPGSTYVRPPNAPQTNGLLEVADALGTLNSGLAHWASNQRQQQNQTDEADATVTAAKLQSGELTPQQFNEQLTSMPDHRRNIYAAYGGQAMAQQFQSQFADWYDTKFDKDKGDVVTEANKFRQQYMASNVTDKFGQAAFIKSTDPMLGAIIKGHQSYLSQKLGDERVHSVSANYDLTVQQLLRKGINDPAQIQRAIEAQAGEAKDKNGLALTGAENDAALFGTAQLYASRGNDVATSAILSAARGGRGSLRGDPDYALKSEELITKAQEVGRQNILANDPSAIANVVTDAHEGVATDASINGLPLTPEAKMTLINTRNLARDEKIKQAQTQQAKQDSITNNMVAKGRMATSAVSLINSGQTYPFTDAEIMNKEGTGPETVSAAEQKKAAISQFETQTDAQFKAREATAGPEVAANEAMAARMKFYSNPSIHDAPEEWKTLLNGAGAATPAIIASKGQVSKDVEGAYSLYKWLDDNNIGMRDLALTDKHSQMLFRAMRFAEKTNDRQAAWSLAANIADNYAKHGYASFNPKDSDIDAQLQQMKEAHTGWLWNTSQDITASSREELRQNAEMYYYANGGKETDAIKFAIRDLQSNSELINGHSVVTNFPGAPPNFAELVHDRLDWYTRAFGKEPHNDVSDPTALYLEPVGGGHNEWQVMIDPTKGTHAGPLTDKNGAPVFITRENLDEWAQDKIKADQANAAEGRRQALQRGDTSGATMHWDPSLLTPVPNNAPTAGLDARQLEHQQSVSDKGSRGLLPAIDAGGPTDPFLPAGQKLAPSMDSATLVPPKASNLFRDAHVTLPTGKTVSRESYDIYGSGGAEPAGGVQERMQHAMQFFVKRGYTPEQSSGIVGNLMQESSLSSKAMRRNDAGPGQHSYGLGQWNRERLIALRRFAALGSKNWRDFDTQLEFVDWELKNNESDAFRALQTARDPVSAARAMILYERPHGFNRGVQHADAYTKRLHYAQQAYSLTKSASN